MPSFIKEIYCIFGIHNKEINAFSKHNAKLMANFKHIVLTHFNLKLSEDGVRRFIEDKTEKPQTKSWMDERFELFDKYCFPTLLNQKNKNFIWLCLFDENTQEKYRVKIAEYQKQFPLFTPIYLAPSDSSKLYEKVDPIIRKYLKDTDEYVITTNLDNDDSFHKNMIDNIQKEFLKNPKELLYRFSYGYQYFTRHKLMLRMKYPHNHFLTLASKISSAPIKPITHYEHANAHRILSFTNILTDPMWIEIVHESNVNNSIRVKFKIKYVPVIKKNIFKQEFNVNIDLKTRRNIFNAFFIFPGLIVKKIVAKIPEKLEKNI